MKISTLRDTFQFWMTIGGLSLRSTSETDPGSIRRKMQLVMCQQGQMNGNETIPLVLYRGQPRVQTSTLLKML